MRRARIYLALCLLGLFLEAAFMIANAPVCIRCHHGLDVNERREVPELCRPCIEQLRKILAPRRPSSADYRPPNPVDPSDPTVTLTTDQGEITIELFQKKAPISVENFLDYVRTGRYDGMLVDRVEPYLVTTGNIVSPRGTEYDAARMPGIQRFHTIPSESSNGLEHRRGVVSLSREDNDANSAASCFFIELADNPSYARKGPAANEAGYTVFGQVLTGLEILDQVRDEPLAGTAAPWRGYEKMPRRPFRFDRVYRNEGGVAAVTSEAPVPSPR